MINPNHNKLDTSYDIRDGKIQIDDVIVSPETFEWNLNKNESLYTADQRQKAAISRIPIGENLPINKSGSFKVETGLKETCYSKCDYYGHMMDGIRISFVHGNHGKEEQWRYLSNWLLNQLDIEEADCNRIGKISGKEYIMWLAEWGEIYLIKDEIPEILVFYYSELEWMKKHPKKDDKKKFSMEGYK